MEKIGGLFFEGTPVASSDENPHQVTRSLARKGTWNLIFVLQMATAGACKDGYHFRRILPRALYHMAHASRTTDKMQASVAELVAAAAAENNTEQPGGTSQDSPMDKVMDKILNNDPHSAQSNVSRLKGCSNFFNSKATPSMTNTTSALMQGLEFACNMLFKRSEIVFKLSRTVDTDQIQELRAEYFLS